MKPIKTLVLLADDARARLFENLGPGKGLNEIEDMAASMVTSKGSEYADRAGRNVAAPGAGRHGVSDLAEAEQDQAREAFVKAVLKEATVRFNEGGFDRVVLAAAPATLGLLREQMPAALKKALVVDVAKDFLKLKPEEVVERLSDEIVL